MKDRGEDFESYEWQKWRFWVLQNMPIGTSTKRLNLMRKQEVESLRGPLILRLDLGNRYIQKSLCTYEHDFWDADACNLHLEMLVMQNGFKPWKLCNAHDLLSYSDFDLIFLLLLWKTQIDCLFFERCDNSCNLILSFANLFGNSLRVYVLFDLVTWQFWSDDNGAIWYLTNQLKYWS